MVHIRHPTEETTERKVAESAYGVGLAQQIAALLGSSISTKVNVGYGRIAAADCRKHSLCQRLVSTTRIESYCLQKVLGHRALLEILLRHTHSSGISHISGVIP